MKSRLLIVIILLGAVLLSACSFSLAEDITPPPNYKSPTPEPTMGPLFPAAPLDLAAGAAIFAEKCQPCHGATGMGDGPQGKQLEVVIPPFGLPEVGRMARPADYYTVVTKGRIDKFMPPFTSLTDQQRWNVVAYVLTLHTKPDEVEKGKELFDAVCSDCPAEIFRDQERMAALSNEQLAQLIWEGGADFPALKDRLTEGGMYEVAAYVRTLSFAAPATTATPEPATATPAATSAEATAVATGEATPQATSEPAVTTTPLGVVSGTVIYAGGALPSDLEVKLQAFEHDAQNPNSGPAQVVDMTGTVKADGSYEFTGVEMLEGRFFTVTVSYAGIDYQAPLAIVPPDQAALTIEPLNIYDTTTATAGLQVSQAHVLAQFDGETLQLLVFYIITNTGDKAVLVETDGMSLPFIPLPAGVTPLGVDPNQGQQGVVDTATGFAMPPSTNQYGMLAAFSLPYKNKAEIKLPIALTVNGGSVLVPENIKVKGDQLTANGTRDMGDGATFAVYTVPALAPGDTLTIALSGKPGAATDANALTGNQSLLIGIGALGLVLILAGVWLYLRDRKQADDDDDDEDLADEEDDSEEVMDAIIALDDQYRASNISEEAYQQRRAELKGKLKRLL